MSLATTARTKELIAELDQLLERLYRDYGIAPAPTWPATNPEASKAIPGNSRSARAVARKPGKGKRDTPKA